jgi:hypothetical protein
VLADLIANVPAVSSGVTRAAALAAGPSPSPSTVSSDSVSPLPSWLIIALLALVGLVVVAMFALTAYSLSAPRSTLKNVLGQGTGRQPPPAGMVTPQLVKVLATSARGGRRTTRTTLAIAGFSLLGVIVVAIFGLTGQGVRDLRSQVVASVTTLVAAIAGFYFGAQTAEKNAGGDSAAPLRAPILGADPKNPSFKIGTAGSYAPILSGVPAPVVSLAVGVLPAGLKLDPATGAITGTPAADTGRDHPLTLMAKNGVSPDATLPLTITVVA